MVFGDFVVGGLELGVVVDFVVGDMVVEGIGVDFVGNMVVVGIVDKVVGKAVGKMEGASGVFEGYSRDYEGQG